MIRYGIVGVLSNAVGYLVYLLITSVGFSPKGTMTSLYVLGATIGFLGNRKWAFSYRGNVGSNLARYGIAHSLGYALNLGLLVLFVDRLGFPHQLIQGLAIFVVGGFLFLMFRFFVFPHCATAADHPDDSLPNL
jgi:putative flippase GtrA